jgi:hypothetical protein
MTVRFVREDGERDLSIGILSLGLEDQNHVTATRSHRWHVRNCGWLIGPALSDFLVT